MRILGIDPGIATIGFGLVEADKGNASMLSYGAITTPAGLPLSKRLYQIDRDMEELIAQLKPDVIDGELVLRFDTKRLRELFGDDPFAMEDPDLTEEEEQELVELLKKVPSPGDALDLENNIGNWYDAYTDYREGLLDQDTYEDWKFKYPAFAGFDENDVAVIYDENQSLVPLDLSEEEQEAIWGEYEGDEEDEE